MSTTINVKPVSDTRVRMPERNNQVLPADGAEVPRNQYWLRRIKDGDVVETAAPKTTNSKPAKAKSEDK